MNPDYLKVSAHVRPPGPPPITTNCLLSLGSLLAKGACREFCKTAGTSTNDFPFLLTILKLGMPFKLGAPFRNPFLILWIHWAATGANITYV